MFFFSSATGFFSLFSPSNSYPPFPLYLLRPSYNFDVISLFQECYLGTKFPGFIRSLFIDALDSGMKFGQFGVLLFCHPDFHFVITLHSFLFPCDLLLSFYFSLSSIILLSLALASFYFNNNNFYCCRASFLFYFSSSS